MRERAGTMIPEKLFLKHYQPVGVLVAATLRRVVRPREVERDARQPLDPPVVVELRPVVPSKVRLSRPVLPGVWCFCQEDTDHRRTEHDSFALYTSAARPGSHRHRQAQARRPRRTARRPPSEDDRPQPAPGVPPARRLPALARPGVPDRLRADGRLPPLSRLLPRLTRLRAATGLQP